MRWWEEHEFELGQTMSWSFGSLTLTITRLKKEWQVAFNHFAINSQDEFMNVVFEPAVQSLLGDFKREAKFFRFAFKETEPTLKMTLHLPDRPLVARPIRPLMISGREMATLYTSAALWLGLAVGAENKKLMEVPTREYSDTWFGPNTTIGELCYASKTNAYLQSEELTKRAHRAVIPVTIHNENNESLKIERINIPVHFLNLYQAFDDHFYGENLLLVRHSSSNTVKIDIEKKSELHRTHRLITASRKKKDDNFIFKTIEMLFA